MTVKVYILHLIQTQFSQTDKLYLCDKLKVIN